MQLLRNAERVAIRIGEDSLIANNLTPEIPNSVVIKLLATGAGATSGSCNAANPKAATLAGGMRAWGTSLHALPTTPVEYGMTETPFLTADLRAAELNHLITFCSFIQSNGSGFGICKGCTMGGLGAAVSSVEHQYDALPSHQTPERALFATLMGQ